MRYILFITCLSLAYGCFASDKGKPLRGYDVKVTNKSQMNIYPILSTEDSKVTSSFGVVGVGNFAVKGFGPFKVIDHVIVTWEEGEPELDYRVKVSFGELLPFNKDITMIDFFYEGDKVWYVLGLDENRKEIVRSKPGVLLVDGKHLN